MRIFVGNLSFNSTEKDLKAVFEKYGTVSSVHIEINRDTGQSRGFAFVQMTTGGDEAIANLNGFELEGRALKVNEALPESGSRHSPGGSGGRRPDRRH